MAGLLRVEDVGPGCERVTHGLLREPVSAWSSLAFVVAAVVIVVAARRAGGGQHRPAGRSLAVFAVLVGGIGVGSVVQHGPNPAWAALAHDLPLLATVAFITADAVADLSRRPREWWWWGLPTALLTPVIHWLPDLGDASMGVVAAAAVLTNLERVRRRRDLRVPVLRTAALLAVGGVLQLLSVPGRPLCEASPSGWWHAVWHVLVAVALAALAPAMGARLRLGERATATAA